MSILKICIAIGLLSLLATAGFTQSGTGQQVNIAEGSSIKLQANAVNVSSYQWLKDGVAILSANNRTYEVKVAGKYSVVTFNTEGCGSDPSAPIEVIINNPGAIVSADLAILKTSENRAVSINDIFEYQLSIKNNGPNTANLVTILDPLPSHLNYEGMISPLMGTATYDQTSRTIHWNILKMDINASADLKIKVKTTKYGIYKNTATITANEPDPNLANNSATDIKSIYGISIPNVFTPNGDGKNDAFEITGLPLYTLNELSIVNRWGSPVYDRKGYQNDWTAYGLSDGTYFYVLKIKDDSSAWQEFKGYVTVLR